MTAGALSVGSMTSTTLAMHMSDGIINAPTSLLFGAVALAGLAFCAVKTRQNLDDRAVPLAGLVAAFIFAVQMVNFPVLPGVSGHLLGGALAAILVGPYTGALCIGVVLVVQSLLFADGGVTALGANITNMALIGSFAGYAVAVVLMRILGARGRTRAACRSSASPQRWLEPFVQQRDSSSSTRSAGQPSRRCPRWPAICGAPTCSSGSVRG